MDNKVLGLNEVETRCRPLYNTVPLKNLLRLPDRIVDSADMPCVLIMEGDDVITKRSTGNYLGYPCSRVSNVIIECWDLSSGNVRNIKDEVLRVVLAEKGVLLQGVLIREQKTIGPFNLGIPKILGMRIVFELSYIDNGLF